MKKNFIFINVFFAILFLLGVIDAYSIGYVVNNPTNLDSRENLLKEFLVHEGNTVTVLSKTTVDVTPYTIVIVSHSVSDIQFDHQHTQTLFMSSKAARKKGLAFSFGSTSGRDVSVDKINTITEGYSLGNLPVYTAQDTIAYISSCFATNSKNIVYKNSKTRSVILMLDESSLLLDEANYNCNFRTKKLFERNLFFGLTEVDQWNNDTKNLFKRSLAWLGSSGLVDTDGDGYYSHESGGDDCNDTDDSIHPDSTDIMKNCKNDPPLITDYSPKNVIKFLKNTNLFLSVNATDDETASNELIIQWMVNGVNAEIGPRYVFNKGEGNYTIEVTVSDGTLTTKKTWTISIQEGASFTCSEIGGNVCTSQQFCEGSTLSVNDSSSCCSVACSNKPLEFTHARKTCETKNSNIQIQFEELGDDTFTLGEPIDYAIRVKNGFDKRMKFDIDSYLYDISKQNPLSKKKVSFSLDKNEEKLNSFNNELAGDLDESHIYALYVYAESENGTCNENYYKLPVRRISEAVVIDYIDFNDEHYLCGDTIEFEMGVVNQGNTNQEVTLTLKNSELAIDESTEEFTLEKHGEDYEAKKKLIVTLPPYAKAGTYSLKAEAHLSNKVSSIQKTITLDECKRQIVEEKELDTIVITGTTEDLSDYSFIKPLSLLQSKQTYLVMAYVALLVLSIAVIYSILRRK